MSKITAAIVSVLSALVAVMLLIPGEQGETFLTRIIKFLTS